MIEHLANCHGEYSMLLLMFGALPLIGPWLAMKLKKRTRRGHKCDA